jgi:hypothetical protein
MIFPLSAPCKLLNALHPEYEERCQSYDDFATLYEGGRSIKDKVGQFLRKRPKELSDVYIVRQINFSYMGLLGNIIGWYRSALFNADPQIVKKVAGKDGAGADKIPGDAAAFCELFEKDCDGAGTTFTGFWPAVLESLLMFCGAYVLVDLPAPRGDEPAPVSLAQQQRAGLLNPNLVFYEPRQVINWETDSRGNLEWVVIYVRDREQDFLGAPKVIDYWYYFDRQECALYQREVKADERTAPDQAIATLVEGYPRPHAMAGMNQVPVRHVKVAKGLWLANRVSLPLMNHLNLENSLDFGLFQSNLAQLVIEDGPNGTYESGSVAGGPPTASEVGYHHLPNGGKMYYLEPAGGSYATTQMRLDTIEERIYKACYLQDQARTNRSTPTAQSGISKTMDKAPSRDVMCALGDLLRMTMQSVYTDVLAVRGFADVVPDVRGLDFSDKAGAEDLDLLDKSTVIQVNSETYEREIAKKNVRLSLPDMNPETLKVIDDEIDANPTPSVQAAAQQEQQRADMLTKFTSSFPGASPGQMTQ